MRNFLGTGSIAGGGSKKDLFNLTTALYAKLVSFSSGVRLVPEHR